MIFECKRKWLFGVFSCALVLRVGLGLSFDGLTQASDEQHWNSLGRAFNTLGVMHPDTGFYRPPLYGFLLAGVYQVFGHSFLAARMVQAVLGALTCLVIYQLGYLVGNQKIGVLAAGICAVYPLFVFFSGVLMSETLFVFLTTVCVLLALKFWQMPTYTGAGLFGTCVGISALCKPVLLPWLLVFLGLWWRCSELKIRHNLLRCLLVVGCMVLVVLPWTLRNYSLSGKWIPISTNTGINLLVGNHLGSDGTYNNRIDYLGMYRDMTGSLNMVEGDAKVVRLVWLWFVDDPLRLIILACYKLLWFWNPLIPNGSVGQNIIALGSSGPLLGLGLWGVWHHRTTPVGIVFGSLVVCLSGLHMIFFAHTRFRLPIDAILCVAAAWVIIEWLDKRMCKRGY